MTGEKPKNAETMSQLPICPSCQRPAHAAESDDNDEHPECSAAVSSIGIKLVTLGFEGFGLDDLRELFRIGFGTRR